MNNKPVNLNEISSQKAHDLILRMLEHNVSDRPYAEEALEHSYLKDFVTGR